jgi:hypothetical protein
MMWQRNGFGEFSRNLLERFESKFIPEPNSGCWIWLAGSSGTGYGCFHFSSELYMSASRAAWLIYRGHIPDDLYVLHHCDVRLCVNPDHLFLGTHADNMTDMAVKGRSGQRRLRVEDVRRIRERLLKGETGRAIARDFNISESVISHIKLRQQWDHVP